MAWFFYLNDGNQSADPKDDHRHDYYALAVHDGNVGARFVVGTGTVASCVLDTQTNLIWAKDGTWAGQRTWQEAQDWASSWDLCGFTDWRVPTKTELQGVISGWRGAPYTWLNSQGFYVVERDYWSSTMNSGSTTGAWEVYMGTGIVQVNDTAQRIYVWPVRGPVVNLAISKLGNGTGAVTSNPAGINCGSDCSENYTPGTSVILDASPSTGSTFSGWSGDCSGNTNTCAITMDASKNVKAIFADITAPTTTPSTLSGTYTSVQNITLSANETATIYYTTDGSDPVTSATRIQYIEPFTISSTTTLKYYAVDAANNASTVQTQTYTITYDLNVTKSGSGTVTSSPPSIECGSNCSASYVSGNSVTLTAVSDASSNFTGWSGDCTGNATTCTVTMNANRNVTANFFKPINLPRTGQTKCYDVSGNEILCTGTGQDGELQAGAVWPNPRFTSGIDAEADCMIDNLTGLMWPKNGNLASKTWDDAIDYTNNLTLCGYSDWRLPNINELESLVNVGQNNSVTWLNTQGFTNVQSDRYWSSTTIPILRTDLEEWVVHMGYGFVYSSWLKTNSFFVWPVRSAQSGSSGNSAVWRTGQTISYRAGDDGDLKQGTSWPSPRFTDNNNGEVTDNLTGLVWTKDANAPGPSECSPATAKTWQQALDYAKCLNAYKYLGHDNWRLPNRKELHSLSDYSQLDASQEEYPALPSGHPFTNVQLYYYWSSTTYFHAYYGSYFYAWYVSIGSGDVSADNKINAYYVWPVRGPFVNLVISKSGNGTGTVSSSPSGINCGSTCSVSYDPGSSITLTATPSAGSFFAGWSGSGCVGIETCSTSMNSDKGVTATFIIQNATIRRVPTEYPSIQTAIDAASNGDTVLVADGTYYENIIFLGKNIKVISSGGRDNCIINGGGREVVKFVNSESHLAKLEGFTLTNGYGYGGGIQILNSSPTISDCLITNNIGNRCGGVMVENGSPTIINTTISKNSSAYADARSSGLEIRSSSSVTLINSRITENTAPTGAGIEISSNGEAKLIAYNSIIDNNYTQGGSGEAGGIYNQASSVTLVNSIVVNNRSDKWGGGIFNQSDNAHVNLINTIVWGNTPNEIYLGGASPGPNDVSASYSIVKGGRSGIIVSSGNATANPVRWGPGNASADPLFVGTSYSLSPSSPCIDAGSNAYNPQLIDLVGNVRIFDGNNDGVNTIDIGAIEYGSPVVATYAISVSKAGTGGGYITDDQTGITCGADCTRTYTSGTKVALTATPDSASSFTGWGGACTGTGTCTVTMDASKNVTANFTEAIPPVVTPSAVGGTYDTTKTVSLTSNETATIFYTTDGSNPLTSVTRIQYTEPFTISSTTTLKYYAVDAANNASTVQTQTYTITYALNVAKSGSGIVTSSPPGIECGSNCSASYVSGNSVTLTAVSDASSNFTGWTGDCTGNARTCTVIMNASKNVTANFFKPIDLPRTGQTKCYDTAGTEVACASTGQDGEIQAGVAWPNPRFTSGTGDESECVIDNLTGLVWAKNGNLSNETKDWQGALDYIKTFNSGGGLCGHTNWRLPNINELESLLNASLSQPAPWLNTQGFTNVQQFGYYLSSTTRAPYTGGAWLVEMWGGNVSYGDKTSNQYGHVWPVRTGSGISAAPSALWKTGQAKCYRGVSPYDEISCAGTGQDGEIQAGVVWPNPRFSDKGDNTVIDNLTGLIWSKDANAPGPSCSPGTTKTWLAALDYIKCLNKENYLGHTDWRIPNKKELKSLVDYSKANPALMTEHPFANVQWESYPYRYWSSTTVADGTVNMWGIDMSSGYPGGGGKLQSSLYVWPVRGGQVSSSVGLTVSKLGTGSGTATSSPFGINCGSTCSTSFASGTSVILTAATSAGSSFTGWSGDGCSGTATTCTVTMDASKKVTVTFTETTAPTGTISINSGAERTNSLAVILALSCTDMGSGCSQMQFSNEPSANWSTPENFTTTKSWNLFSPDETKTVYVKFKDAAGNWSDAISDTIILDTAQPAVPAPISLGQNPVNVNKPTLSWNAISDPATYTLQYANNPEFLNSVTIPGITGTSYAMPSILSDGTWYWKIKATDLAGNEGAWSTVSSFVEDTATKRVPSEYSTIQAAIDAAIAGDTVLVSPGTYKENIDFKGKNITVGSLFLMTGDSSYIEQTVIDGNANGYPVVRFLSGESRSAILVGVTIQNGFTATNEQGAGIDIRGTNTQPTLRNLIIKNNNSQSGRGGGLACYYAGNTLIENSTISNNRSSEAGGGIYAFQSSLTINNSIISNNNGSWGSALCMFSAVNISITSSLIFGNDSGGGSDTAYLAATNTSIVNTTISNNKSPNGVNVASGNVNIKNSIISGHSAYNVYIGNGILWIEYSLVKLGQPSIRTPYPDALKWNTGNIASDPLFFDPANGDYRLRANSPCIDTGTATGAPSTDIEGALRPKGAGYDMGAYEAYLPVQLVAYSPNVTKNNTLTLDWNDVAGASQYRLQYSRSSDFQNKVEVSNITNSSYTFQSALPDGDLFWKVIAIDADGKSGWWSSTEKVTIDTAAPVTTRSLSGGTYIGSQTITLTANDPSANIYYTLDGSVPTTQSLVYSGTPINISSTTTLNYITVDAAGNSSAVQTANFIITPPAGNGRPIPDTGQTKCFNNTAEISCPAPGAAFYGQDGNYSINPPSYTKLDATGNALSDSTTSWVMVKDNVTGLIWENKTNDGSIHDKDNVYTWCDTNPATNGGNQGACGSETGNAATDTEAYIKALNDAKFGGFSDWRMPSSQELMTIIDRNYNPTINTNLFSNTVSAYYWSSSTDINGSWYANFNTGSVLNSSKAFSYAVRAIRGEQQKNRYVTNSDGTVTDTTTGLMWQREGVSGKAWGSALSYAEGLDDP